MKREYPDAHGIPVRHLNGRGPTIVLSGYWLYLVPPELWAGVPKAVKKVLSSLYLCGYRSLSDVAETPNSYLLDRAGIGEQNLGQLVQWLYTVRTRNRTEDV